MAANKLGAKGILVDRGQLSRLRHIQAEKAEEAREAAGGMTSVHEEPPQRGGSHSYQ